MIIYGWGTKATPLGITDIRKCENCGNTGPWFVYEAKKQFKLYWIPVAQWNKHFAAVCPVCERTWKIPPENLQKVLAEGEKNNEERVFKIAAAILKSVAKVGGMQSKEWAKAVQLLVELSEHTLTKAKAEQLMREATAADIDPYLYEENDRFVLLGLAINVTLADGSIDAEEVKALEALAARLLLPVDAVQILINRLTGNEGGESGYSSAEETNAYKVLGLEPGVSVAEIRTAYRRLIRQHHPDLAAPAEREEATRISAQIVAAYDFLIGRVSDSGDKSSNRQKSQQKTSTTQNTPPPPPPPKSPKKNLCASCERKLEGHEKFCGFCGTKV